LPQQLRRLFERWAHLPWTAAASEDPERAALRQLYDELEQQLEAYETDARDHHPDERMLSDLTAFLGDVRGLLDAMAETRSAHH
jgi:Rubisco LSMT substrate-binding